MRICLVNTTPFWGGGEKWFYENAVLLSASGYRVFVLASNKGVLHSKLSKHPLIQLAHLQVGNLSFLNPFLKSKVKAFLEKEQIEAILINGSPEVKLCAPIAKNLGLKNIIYRRGSAIPVKGSALNKAIFGNALTHIIANSQATKATLLKHLEPVITAEKITVIQNGVDSQFEIKEPNNPVFTLGTLGRLTHQKGYDLLIRIALELKRLNLDFIWKVAGGGELHATLLSQIESAGLQNYVRLLGEIDNVNEFLQSLDLYVHTARWEGFGYAIAEAMANAKAVVAFDISSNPELVENNQTGALVPFENIEAMAESISALQHNIKERTAMGLKGRQLISDKLSKKGQFVKLHELLSGL